MKVGMIYYILQSPHHHDSYWLLHHSIIPEEKLVLCGDTLETS